MEEILDEMIGNCTGAAIFSVAGIVWYSTQGFYTNPKEFKTFSKVFVENSNVIYDGITFQNQVYITLSLNDDMFVATSNTSCVVMCKCDECIIFAYDENKTNYEALKSEVSKMAEKIKENELDKQFL